MYQIKAKKSIVTKFFFILLLIITVIIVSRVFNLIHVLNTDSLDLYFENKEVFRQVSDIIFKGLESGTIQEGETLNLDYTPERLKSLGITRHLKKLGKTNSIESIRIKDADLLWFVVPGKGHSISGVAITKNNVSPEREDDSLNFDEGTLLYRKIDNNTYFFSAGL